ncbi:hypothetical protein ES703_06160 [subsurface metagenome]
MDGWGFADKFALLISRFPIERLWSRSSDKDLDRLEQSLKEKGLYSSPLSGEKVISQETASTATTEPPRATPLQAGTTASILERKGLPLMTKKWQLDVTRADLWQLEGHLKNKCLDCGDPPTCCWKHGQNLIDIVTETKSMTTDPVWQEISNLGEEVILKCHPDAIVAETYFADLPALVLRTSELRLKMDDMLIELQRPAITLEQAKAEAAEVAAKRVEEAWEKGE